MSLPNQLVGKNIQSRTVYNGSGTAIPFGTALALDASYPPQTYNAPGVKTTTGATDVVGFALTSIPAGGYGSMQVGGTAVAIAGGTITFGTTLAVMTNSSGQVIAKTATNRSAGVPFSTAASGEYVLVQLGAGADNA